VLSADPNPYSLSTEFMVTVPGCTITGYWFWCPSGGATVAVTLSLWSCTTGTTGTRITAANATSGTLTANAWNFTACAATALTPGQHYRAIVTHTQATSWYGGTGGYWTTGNPGAVNLANGPLVAFTASEALGGIQGGVHHHPERHHQLLD
jgi:hypothetical protein